MPRCGRGWGINVRKLMCPEIFKIKSNYVFFSRRFFHSLTPFPSPPSSLLFPFSVRLPASATSVTSTLPASRTSSNHLRIQEDVSLQASRSTLVIRREVPWVRALSFCFNFARHSSICSYKTLLPLVVASRLCRKHRNRSWISGNVLGNFFPLFIFPFSFTNCYAWFWSPHYAHDSNIHIAWTRRARAVKCAWVGIPPFPRRPDVHAWSHPGGWHIPN